MAFPPVVGFGGLSIPIDDPVVLVRPVVGFGGISLPVEDIKVLVVDQNGTPIEGAEVYCTQTSTASDVTTATTDSAGECWVSVPSPSNTLSGFRFIVRKVEPTDGFPFCYQVFENKGITWADPEYSTNEGVVVLTVTVSSFRVATPNLNPFARFDTSIAVNVAFKEGVTTLESTTRLIIDRGNSLYNTYWQNHVQRGSFVLLLENWLDNNDYGFVDATFNDLTSASGLKANPLPIAGAKSIEFTMLGFCNAPSIWKTDVLDTYDSMEEPDWYYYRNTTITFALTGSGIGATATTSDPNASLVIDSVDVANLLPYFYTNSVVVKTTTGSVINSADVLVYSSPNVLYQTYSIASNPTGNSQNFPTVHICDITDTGSGTLSWDEVGVIRLGINPATGLPFEEFLITPAPTLVSRREERRDYYELVIFPVLCDGLGDGSYREAVGNWFKETCSTRHPLGPHATARVAGNKELLRVSKIGNAKRTLEKIEEERFWFLFEMQWERLKCEVANQDGKLDYSYLDGKYQISCIDQSEYCFKDGLKTRLQTDLDTKFKVNWLK